MNMSNIINILHEINQMNEITFSVMVALAVAWIAYKTVSLVVRTKTERTWQKTTWLVLIAAAAFQAYAVSRRR